MKKNELIDKMSEKTGLTKKDTQACLEAFQETITEMLVKGDSLNLIGFGKFEVRKASERKGRNPKTGEEITIPASKRPAFKAGKSLKDAVNK